MRALLVKQRLKASNTIQASIVKFIASLSLANLKHPQSIEFSRHKEQLQEQGIKHGNPYNDPLYFLHHYSKSSRFTQSNTKIVHTLLVKSCLLQSDVFVANSLLHWYCKSGSVFDGVKVFDNMPQWNVISWNLLISGYNGGFLFEDSWDLFCRMCSLGFEPNEVTYGSVLSTCVGLNDPFLGTVVYALVTKSGFYADGYVQAGMIDVFAKNGRLDYAFRVLYDAQCENVVCWNSIISWAVRDGENWAALDLFRQLCRGSLLPNSFTFSSILTACATLEDIEIGKCVQGCVIKHNAEDVFVGTSIVDLYAKCGDMGEALKQLSRMPTHNVVSSTALISGFVRKDDPVSAFRFFGNMLKEKEEINNFTITSIISACAKTDMIKEAMQLHCWIFKTGFHSDPVVGAALINMYAKAGCVDSSEMVFRENWKFKNSTLWNTMIVSFAQDHSLQEAIELLQRMLQDGLRPDNYSYSSVLSVVDTVNLGRQIHIHILKSGFVFDLTVGSSLFTMYSKCGCIEESYKVFEEIPVRDNVSWASMIAGFSESGCIDRAFALVRDMFLERTSPDQLTLVAILTACSSSCSLQKGKEVHGFAFRANVNTETQFGSALVAMYSKHGALEAARRVFDMLPEKDQFAYSSLMSGYSQNGLLEEAILLFREMLINSSAAFSFTIPSILGAVALLNKLSVGLQLHGLIIKIGLDSDISVGSSLLTMYSRCGCVEDCSKTFDKIEKPDLIGWTAMIASYAQHGKGVEALKVYEQMRREGILPDSVTFVGILTACTHANLIDEGFAYFNSMTKDFGIVPNVRHYACMVDLLGRAGRLREAKMFVQSVPTDIKSSALVWGTLLAACKLHGDIELGQTAAEKVMELEPCDAGAYVSLSNIYAEVGQWEEVLEVRHRMKGSGVQKEPGWSFM